MKMNRKMAGIAKTKAMYALKITYIGNLCKNGHPDGIRYVNNKRCVECSVLDALKQNETRKIERRACNY